MKKTIPKGSVLIPDSASCVYRGVIFDVYQWQQKLYDDSYKTFEMLKRPDTVTIFAIVDDKVLLLEDEQPQRDTLLALPGGRVDPEDGSSLFAAKRETLEETGYSFDNWRLVWVEKPEEKLEWFIHTFIAWGVSGRIEPDPGNGEKITTMLKSFEEIQNLRAGGEQRLLDERVLERTDTLEALLHTPDFDGVMVDR